MDDHEEEDEVTANHKRQQEIISQQMKTEFKLKMAATLGEGSSTVKGGKGLVRQIENRDCAYQY
tara:strand:- start:1213 stop:1404 length:192 start_codon:yes stop_codon:yes gene_type:complete